MIPVFLHLRRLREVDETRQAMAIVRRRIRDNSNILEMPDAEFRSNFRMEKNCFANILDEVAPWMKTASRSTYIPAILKLGSFLRFLAAGSYQKAVGNEHMTGMSQAKISLTLHECLEIFERHICPQWIRFEMSEAEEGAVKENFFRKFGIPGVIGCVDGTHIKIKSPGDLAHLYYNRKGYCSLNAMIICDSDMVIRYVDARPPGANHDAFVWRISVADELLRSAYNAGKRNTWLLGDSGYQLLPFLMTPYRQPQQRYEIHFNQKHTTARNVIERCFGVLKGRFRSIIGERGLHYKPECATQIVNACCALHNICLFYKNDWEMDDLPEPENFSEESETQSDSATAVRDELARSLCE